MQSRAKVITMAKLWKTVTTTVQRHFQFDQPLQRPNAYLGQPELMAEVCGPPLSVHQGHLESWKVVTVREKNGYGERAARHSAAQVLESQGGCFISRVNVTDWPLKLNAISVSSTTWGVPYYM